LTFLRQGDINGPLFIAGAPRLRRQRRHYSTRRPVRTVPGGHHPAVPAPRRPSGIPPC
jgi:hypothetical protein